MDAAEACAVLGNHPAVFLGDYVSLHSCRIIRSTGVMLMNRSTALERLGLRSGASVEQITYRYRDLHDDLERRVGDAPTAALRSAYLHDLQTLKDAFDSLLSSPNEEPDYFVPEAVLTGDDVGGSNPDHTDGPVIHSQPVPSLRSHYLAAMAFALAIIVAVGALNWSYEEHGRTQARAAGALRRHQAEMRRQARMAAEAEMQHQSKVQAEKDAEATAASAQQGSKRTK